MRDITPFLHPDPPKTHDDSEEINRLCDELAEKFAPTYCNIDNHIHITEEELSDLREACVSDSTRIINHFGPLLKEKQEVLIRQVEAIEKIAQSAKSQADASDKLSQSAKNIAISAQNQANNSNQIAGSAQTLSNLANKKAGKADVKSWIAIAVSIMALIVEIISNWTNIFAFFQAII